MVTKKIQLNLTQNEQQTLIKACEELEINMDFLVSEALRNLLIELKQRENKECVC